MLGAQVRKGFQHSPVVPLAHLHEDLPCLSAFSQYIGLYNQLRCLMAQSWLNWSSSLVAMVMQPGALLTKLKQERTEVGGRQEMKQAKTEDENTLITLIDNLW